MHYAPCSFAGLCIVCDRKRIAADSVQVRIKAHQRIAVLEHIDIAVFRNILMDLAPHEHLSVIAFRSDLTDQLLCIAVPVNQQQIACVHVYTGDVLTDAAAQQILADIRVMCAAHAVDTENHQIIVTDVHAAERLHINPECFHAGLKVYIVQLGTALHK